MNGAYSYLLESAETADERDAWQWLIARSAFYAQIARPSPLRPRTVPDKARAFVACQLFYDEQAEYECPRPQYLLTYDGVTHSRFDLSSHYAGWRAFRDAMLVGEYRGKLLVYINAARLGFHALLRWYGEQLIADGYVIQPIATSTEIRAIIVRKDKHRWTFVDAAIVTGLDDIATGCQSTLSSGATSTTLGPQSTLYGAIAAVQDHLLHVYSTALSITLPAASVRALTSFMADDGWLWPASPLMQAICRDGHAYRGGYIFARPWRGEGWQIDLTRAYTWSLSQDIPTRWAVGPCWEEGKERDGIYLCRVSGSLRYRAYLPVWRGREVGFTRGYYQRGSCLSLLTSTEWHGLRSLGLSVVPRWGLVVVAATTFGPLTDVLDRVRRETGRGSPYDQIAKQIGNAIYGKLGESPTRQDRYYSRDVPAADAYPALTPWGEEIPDLWERWVTRASRHQHVDVAAILTARVLSRMYGAIAAFDAAGINTRAAYIDSLIVDADPSGIVPTDAGNMGDWRLVDHSDNVVICANNAWRFGMRVKVPGSVVAEPGIIDDLYDTGAVTIAQRRMLAPWTGTVYLADVHRTLRVPASEDASLAGSTI